VAKTFGQMVAEAKSQVPGISPQEAQARTQQNSKALVIDVRQAEDIASTGAIPGSINVPLGVLAIKADQELPAAITDSRLQDRDQEIIVTCAAGGQASLGAKTLQDMGFTNVSYVDGGTRGWKEAGLPTQ
jgi:rhodanese-related sulfurtransferase